MRIKCLAVIHFSLLWFVTGSLDPTLAFIPTSGYMGEGKNPGADEEVNIARVIVELTDSQEEEICYQDAVIFVAFELKQQNSTRASLLDFEQKHNPI